MRGSSRRAGKQPPCGEAVAVRGPYGEAAALRGRGPPRAGEGAAPRTPAQPHLLPVGSPCVRPVRSPCHLPVGPCPGPAPLSRCPEPAPWARTPEPLPWTRSPVARVPGPRLAPWPLPSAPLRPRPCARAPAPAPLGPAPIPLALRFWPRPLSPVPPSRAWARTPAARTPPRTPSPVPLEPIPAPPPPRAPPGRVARHLRWEPPPRGASAPHQRRLPPSERKAGGRLPRGTCPHMSRSAAGTLAAALRPHPPGVPTSRIDQEFS